MDKNHNDSDMAYEAIANMFGEIKEILEDFSNNQPAQPTIPPEITNRLDTILNEIKALKPSVSFSAEQKEYLKWELRNAVRDITKTLARSIRQTGRQL